VLAHVNAGLERATGIVLDHAYTAKSFAVALSRAREHQAALLFWHTFDGRVL